MRGVLWLGLVPLLGATLSLQQRAKPTYSADIRPIIAQKCVSCHNADGLGPFALQTYEQTRKRGDLVRQVALTGQMPPTDARSDFGSLSKCPPLESKELLVIQEWYRLGMPKGETTPPLTYTDAWEAPGAGSQEVRKEAGQGQKIPAEGQSARIVYPVAALDGTSYSFTDFRFKPDAPKAVRQVVLAIQRAGQPAPFTAEGIRSGAPIAVWSQGFNDSRGGVGKLQVNAQDRLWIQVRAVPTGKTEPASGTVSLVDSSQGELAESKTLGTSRFTVDADSQKVLRDEWVLERDIDLISVLPEARFTTEQIKLTVRSGDEVKTVLMVLTWDPVWPGAYNFSKPVRLKKGDTLIYESMINNSKHGHAAEEEKPKALKFGPRPQDELFWCHLTYVPR